MCNIFVKYFQVPGYSILNIIHFHGRDFNLLHVHMEHTRAMFVNTSIKYAASHIW